MTRVLEYGRIRREMRSAIPLDTAIERSLSFGIASDLGVRAHEPGHRE